MKSQPAMRGEGVVETLVMRFIMEKLIPLLSAGTESMMMASRAGL